MNYVENYISSILNEVNYIFSKEDKYYNFDNWKRRLYIVGLSGSGKTTLGKQLSEKYNVPYIELDNFFIKIFKDKFGKDIFREFKDWRLRKSNPKRDKELSDISDKVFHIMEKEIYDMEEKCIIEGVQIYRFDLKMFTKDDAVIFKNTSLLKSRYRLIKDKDARWGALKHLKYGITGVMKSKEFENKINEIYSN